MERDLRLQHYNNRIIKCPTGKIIFRDKGSALYELALLKARRDPTRPKREKRAYRCEYCKGWHLTARRTTT